MISIGIERGRRRIVEPRLRLRPTDCEDSSTSRNVNAKSMSEDSLSGEDAEKSSVVA